MDVAVGVQDVFGGCVGVEFGIPAGRLIQCYCFAVDGLGDLDFVVKDRHHQLPVVFHDRALTRRERKRLGPAGAEAQGQGTLLGCIVDCARITCDVQARDPQSASCGSDLHERVEHRGRGLLGVPAMAVATRFKADSINSGVDFADAEDLFDLVSGVSVGDVDGFTAEAAGLGEPFLVQVPDNHHRSAEQLRSCGSGQPYRPCAGDVNGGTDPDAGRDRSVETGGEKCPRAW